MKPRALVLRTAGTNCDGETAHALTTAGAEVTLLHINRLLEDPKQLAEFQVLAVPGGFSYGDDIAAGRIFANQLMHHLKQPLKDFVAAGKPIIGVCNGFQVLIKTELLPGPTGGSAGQSCTLTDNDCGHFVDRWVKLKATGNKCIWTRGLREMELPIAHGEGKFVPGSEAVRKSLWDNGQVALTYSNENPNGSTDAIAGVCDSTGLVFGLMPHPERHVTKYQHPAWTSRPDEPEEAVGLTIFRNAVEYVTER